MRWLILVGFLLSFAVAGQSTGGGVNITEHVEFLEDKDGSLTVESVSAADFRDKFTPSDRLHLHFGFNESYYWLRFNLPVANADSLVLELEHAFIPYAELFWRRTDSTWASVRSGYKVPLIEKPVKGHFQTFPLPANTEVFYLRLVPYLHPVTLSVWEKGDHLVHAARQQMVYGIYAGILLFAVLINMFLFFALRKSYYLLYSLLVTLYIAAAAGVMEGFLIYLFPGVDMMFWYKLIPVMNMPALLLYCISFLELKRFSRTAFIITLTTAMLVTAYNVMLIFTPMLPFLAINQVLSVVVFVLAISVGILTGKRGNKLGYYFSITYSIWFVLLCFELVYISYGVPPHVFELSYVSVAIFTEALMLAFLQVKRFQWERKADERMRLDMQRNMTEMQMRTQSEIMRAQLEMQEQTLQSVSQEIHDNIGQTLSLVKINLNIAHNKSVHEKERLVDSIELLSKAIQELRELTRTMSTDYIHEAGLPAAIDEQVRILRKTGAYKVDYVVRGRVVQLQPQHELLLFRIVQELINNTIKHANATSIEISLRYDGGGLIIDFKDNGRGFDIKDVSSRETKGLGLNHMTQRAELVGGTFKVESVPGGGAHFTITIPASA